MSTTQPIKDRNDLELLKGYYRDVCPNPRNYALISTGINTALRISDILSLRWRDVCDLPFRSFRRHISIIERKTKKTACIAINRSLSQALSLYLNTLPDPCPEDYIFHKTYPETPDVPLSRSQAFRIIKRACSRLALPEHISCHSLRKTFGYHAWAAGANPTVLMVIYNHSSFSVTKRYLGIEQEDKDNIFLNLNL